MIQCPGCGVKKKYEQMFEHIQTCDKIQAKDKTNRNDMMKAINQAANELQPAFKAKLADNIYVIEKDTKVCAVFNRRTGVLQKGALNLYTERMQPQNTLPHNFQLV